jgi:hypothetical protein
VWVWCPQNFDVDRLLAAFDRRVVEGVLWLGHCVYAGLANDARCRDTGWVHLRAEYLRHIIGRHHLDAVRAAAREIGYVGRDPSYRVGTSSQTYWILPPYDRAVLVQRQITEYALRKNIRHWRDDQQRKAWQKIERGETPVAEAVCRHLWRNLQRIRLDAEIEFPEPFHPAHQVAVEQIRHGELRFTVDDYGRIHTNLTNLSRMLRPYLTVDGGRLANVDISESQPLFFGIALASAWAGRQTNCRVQHNSSVHHMPAKRPNDQPRRDETKRQDEQERKAAGWGGTRAAHHTMDTTMLDTTMLDTTMLDTTMLDTTMLDTTMLDGRECLVGEFEREQLPGDLRRYLELCECRALYQTVADRLGTTRDKAKKRVMVVLFDRPWHRNRVSNILDELVPAVMEDMREIKQPNHRRLAHFAQKVESAFMFGRVVPRIMRERPDLFISTIHDSILTPVADAQFVRGVMLDEFAQLGVSPQVKVEPCSIAVPRSPDSASQGIPPKAT